jgi:hypothetical protein
MGRTARRPRKRPGTTSLKRLAKGTPVWLGMVEEAWKHTRFHRLDAMNIK